MPDTAQQATKSICLFHQEEIVLKDVRKQSLSDSRAKCCHKKHEASLMASICNFLTASLGVQFICFPAFAHLTLSKESFNTGPLMLSFVWSILNEKQTSTIRPWSYSNNNLKSKPPLHHIPPLFSLCTGFTHFYYHIYSINYQYRRWQETVVVCKDCTYLS